MTFIYYLMFLLLSNEWLEQQHLSIYSPLCCSPLLPIDLCPNFPEEEKPAAPRASGEVQKLRRGETAKSRLSYMCLTELTSTSCNGNAYLCWDKEE